MSQHQSISRATILDFQEQPEPSNPPANIIRLYADSATGKLAAIDDNGNNAFPGGGGGTPGGSSTDVQFNSSGVFGGNGGFAYDGTAVTVSGTLSSSDIANLLVLPTTAVSGNVSEVTAVVTQSLSETSGTVTLMTGVHVHGNENSIGTVTANNGILIEDQSGIGGSNYALHIASQANTSPGNWSVKVESGLSEFGGPVTADAGILVGSASGGNLGAGTVNVSGDYYINGTAISNFVSPLTTLGDTVYENATPAAARLPGNFTATKNFLTQTGTGIVSAAPAWGTIAASDLPATGTWNFVGTLASSGAIQVFGELIDSVDSTGLSGQVLSSTSVTGSPPGGGVKWVWDVGANIINVKNFGALGNCKRTTDAQTVISGNIVNSASANFTNADLGKAIYCVHATTKQFASSTIQAVNSATQVVIAGTVTAANTGCTLVYGNDDTNAILAAAAAAVAAGVVAGITNGTQLYFPPGSYWFGHSGVSLPALNLGTGNVDLVGGGTENTILYIPPDFPYSATGSANVINQSGTITQQMRDLTVDFSNVVPSVQSNFGFIDCITGIVRNFQITNFNNTGNSAALTVNGQMIDNFQISATAGTALTSAAAGNFYITNSSVSTGSGTAFTSSQGFKVKATNCAFTGTTAAFAPGNSAVTDGEFVNCRFTGTTTAVNTGVANSSLRFTNCWIEATTALTAIANTTVFASNCTIKSDSTVAVSNAGTFVDLGGNTFTGTFSGTGVYLGNAYTLSKDRISGEQGAIPSGSPPTSATLYAVPSNGQGYYEINYVATITAPGSVSSTLGGANGFQVTYTNGNGDSATKTSPAGPTSSANTNGTMLSGSITVYAAASSNITYSFGYASSGATLMTYDLAATVTYRGI